LTSIPGVSTTGQQISVYQNKAPFHHKVLFL
jgi:hypothetical protein